MKITRIILTASLVLFVIGLVFVYYTYNPSTSSFFPVCLSHYVTGLQCPGCGSQRALHALLHADIAQAFHYNALLILSIPYIILLLWGEWGRNRSQIGYKIYKSLHKPVITIIYALIVILFTIIRNF